jgi:hypothetical protein
MKITRADLKKLIKEELSGLLGEDMDIDQKVEAFLRSWCKSNDDYPDFDDVKNHFGDSWLASEVWDELKDTRKPCA